MRDNDVFVVFKREETRERAPMTNETNDAGLKSIPTIALHMKKITLMTTIRNKKADEEDESRDQKGKEEKKQRIDSEHEGVAKSETMIRRQTGRTKSETELARTAVFRFPWRIKGTVVECGDD